ncbi:hypothetical protein Tfer_2090 [Thermincola ferriacetica]|uniref:DUF1540 domain-containing protein n=2 Tax=Thermincola TaxID=278993 RepID=D5XDZ2_THEPJ|nr:protein of unknown function DUF1540 [Thermincola potens JR]KNZ69293.1 hypothetical protein Tfer_2090 [Thermincola ferriacetica]
METEKLNQTGGGDSVPDIKCNVVECHYNKNIMCNAPMIQVDHSGVSRSTNSEQTKCETFKPKA